MSYDAGNNPNARPEKKAEKNARPGRDNTIVTVWKQKGKLAPGVTIHGNATVEWGPGYEQYKGKLSVGQVLDMEHKNGVDPIIWAYNSPDANFTSVDFGYDKKVGDGKIGHMALTAHATISGEIHPDGAGGWKIDNNSGAWGNMGGHDGKTRMLQQVATWMTENCGMQVKAEKAYSRHGALRKIQQLYR